MRWLIIQARNRIGALLPLFVFATAMTGIVIAVRRGRASLWPNGFEWSVASTLFPALAGLIFWFFTAPDSRFAMFDIWTFDAVFVAVSALLLGDRLIKWARPALVLLFLAALFANPSRYSSEKLHAHIDDPAAPMPHGRMQTFTTRSGLVVYTPKILPGQFWNQSWYAPLPNTPSPDADLRLRKPGNLAAGFVTSN
jgi:hypothetical protein